MAELMTVLPPRQLPWMTGMAARPSATCVPMARNIRRKEGKI